MLAPTRYTIDPQLLAKAVNSLDLASSRTRLNRPTGRFFYDPWQIDPRYADTVWAQILATLPEPIGEARIISLISQSCYTSHADIDNRWHLNLTGEASYLIDLEQNRTHLLAADCTWYTMDAGRRHTAANFGRGYRSQLVVRQLLKSTVIDSAVNVRITHRSFGQSSSSRYVFDNTISPWLNRQNLQGGITDFDYDTEGVSFTVNAQLLDELRSLVGSNFKLIVV